MPHGAASRKKAQKAWSQARTAAKKAAKRAERESAADSELTGTGSIASQTMETDQLRIPTVTEDDLLAFQFQHFGDDTRPVTFFVDPETALSVGEAYQTQEDDDLGYYSDGVKRTLTDKQIAIFRHTEMEEFEKAQTLEREEVDNARAQSGTRSSAFDPSKDESQTASNSLTAVPRNTKKASRETPNSSAIKSESIHRNTRTKEVPYDQRHKRKWEDFIEGDDPVHGSITHRRAVRELDEQKVDMVEMDYG